MKRLAVFVLSAALPVAPVIAHHSFIAQFDTEAPISLAGVVTRVEWQSPHIWFYIDVTDENGNVEEWGVSGGSPGQLMRRGIYKSVLEIGMTLSVEGFQARDGSNNAGGRRVTLPDGSNVFTAGPEAP